MYTMSNHLNIERISALLDEPERDPEGRTHLEGCERCRRELELLGRMRMALSGLGPMDPPADEWDRISARLGAASARRETGDRGGAVGRPPAAGPRSWPLWSARLAAGVLLFAGGILAGHRFAAPDPGGPSSVAAAADDGRVASVGTDLDPASAFADLDEPLPVARHGEMDGLDPVAAAERLARLDAMIAASREAVSEAPADPVANDLLFELIERRENLAGRLEQTLHLATLEVR